MERTAFYVGLDIASATFTATILTEPAKPSKTNDPFTNSLEGFTRFAEWLLEHHVTPHNALMCMEATGVYGESLCYFLATKGYRVAVEPPLKVKRAFNTSGHKTDAVDSAQIAEYAHRFIDELNFWKPSDAILEQIKVLLSAREQFTCQLTANLTALKTIQRKYIQTPLANQVYHETIEQLKENIKDIDKEIKRLIDQDPTFRQMIGLMLTIPGVGMLLASNLLVLTRGFTRPVTAKQIAAHAGICPYQHISGSSVYRRPRSRRHGPSKLRKLLYLAALSLRTHNDEFKRYFHRKVAEGKSKRLVINNIENKLLKIICAVISSQTRFIPHYRSVNPILLKCA
jgi:transposase